MLKVECSSRVIAEECHYDSGYPVLTFECFTGHESPWDSEYKIEFFEGDSSVFEENDEFSISHFDHWWKGTEADALKLVEESLRDKSNWRFCHKPGDEPRLSFDQERNVNQRPQEVSYGWEIAPGTAEVACPKCGIINKFVGCGSTEAPSVESLTSIMCLKCLARFPKEHEDWGVLLGMFGLEGD